MAGKFVRSLVQVLKDNAAARYIMYPIVAGEMPAGVALPHDNNTNAGLWGVWTQILLAVAAPATEYWYCGYQILTSAAAGVQPHAVQVGSGLVATPPTAIHNSVDGASRAAAADDATVFQLQKVSYPIYQPAATPVSGQSAVTAKAAQQNITVTVLLATGF